MDFKRIWLKILDRQKYLEYKNNIVKERGKKLYENKIKSFLSEVDICLAKKNEISFLHSGTLGDIINALPIIKEISKTKKCNLYIQPGKKIPIHALSPNHPSGNSFLSDKAADKLLPLLKRQSYLNFTEKFRSQAIDIDLDFFRELFVIGIGQDVVRRYFYLTGVHPNIDEPYIEVDDHNKLQNKIVIVRSLRRKNFLINYKFLSNYQNLVFLGLKDEFLDLKQDIPNLEFYDCKNFLEMSEIIKNSKIFIANLSFGYTLADALKIPRLLESDPGFPCFYPTGGNGYDFYFQNHFENIFNKLYSK